MDLATQKHSKQPQIYTPPPYCKSVALALLLIPSLTASAQTAQDAYTNKQPATASQLEEQLPESVITALRSPSNLADTPYSVEAMDDAELTSPQFYSLPDALGSLPGVMNQKTGQGHGSPYIRGFTSFRNLMLIDGIRFNNSVFRDGPNQYWNTIDAYALGGVELVRGPGSTLYGSDAIGGTINALTRGTRYREANPRVSAR